MGDSCLRGACMLRLSSVAACSPYISLTPNHHLFLLQVDVYSFAVLCWEMLTGRVPWRELAGHMQIIFQVGVMRQVSGAGFSQHICLYLIHLIHLVYLPSGVHALGGREVQPPVDRNSGTWRMRGWMLRGGWHVRQLLLQTLVSQNRRHLCRSPAPPLPSAAPAAARHLPSLPACPD